MWRRRRRVDFTVVVVVHYAGQSCEMEAIHMSQIRFRIIEDASHAIGGRYQGNAVGSCQYSDMCVFSFHPVKIVTTGEGGMIVTNDPDLAERLVIDRMVCEHPDRMQERPKGKSGITSRLIAVTITASRFAGGSGAEPARSIGGVRFNEA